MRNGEMKNLGNWLDVEQCSSDGCGARVTHVIFLNTPYDFPYVVGSCARHKAEPGGFAHMTLRRFEQELNSVMFEHPRWSWTGRKIALEVARQIDPGLKGTMGSEIQKDASR